ncbi:MAG TPA: SH3-like domain-containing protein [Alphaproteobacteria bacterium]|nr:SH3-like domain-containing protein [Alphaproteobacteria bacterium]
MSARFGPGDRVRVRAEWPEASGGRVHLRTPGYLRGRVGVVERTHGDYADPEKLAFGKPGYPKRTLYMVRFDQRDLWPCGEAPDGTVVADIFDHWLDPAAKESPHG